MSGGGIGSALGTGLGVLMAPETGGMSMLIPAGMGALGGAAGAMASGGNPLTSGLMGGASGLAGGFLSGLLSPAADTASGAADAGGSGGSWLSNLFGGSDSGASGVAGAGSAGNIPSDIGSQISSMPSAAPPVSGIPQSTWDNIVSGSPSGATATGQVPSSIALPSQQGSSSGSWLSKIFGGSPSPGNVSGAAGGGSSSGVNGRNLLQAGGLLTALLGAFQPQQGNQVNVGGTASSVLGTNPGYTANLPKYNMQSSSTPYTGNWYTYGQRPQTPLYSNQAIPGMRHGGMVRALQMGGPPMQAPMGAPAAAPPTPPMAPQRQNPQQSVAQFQMGQKIGQALRQHIKGAHTPDGMVRGPGKGQDDAVPAKLSRDEYILPSEIVSQLGDGSSAAGGKELDKMVHNIRAHKTSHGGGFPPRAKSPLAYIGKR